MSAIWDKQQESGATGGGQFYDEINLFYDALEHPESGNDDVYYDGIGSVVTWTNQSES